jgi:hypothetical protein
MKYFNIDGVLNEEMQRKFSDFANENKDEEWTITIYSTGGLKIVARFILSVINSRFERVTLISQESYSAAFTLFREAKCKKQIANLGKGMYHLGRVSMDIMANGKPVYFEDVSLLNNFREDTKNERKWVKKFMTKKEARKFKKGEDVYFTFKRMKEIFPDAEII